MQSGSLVASMVLALKLSLCLCSAKFISGVQSLHGFGTYRFPSETISAISILPSHHTPKRSSYYGGSTSTGKSNSQSTLVAIPLYIRGAAQSKPPMLFDILSSSLTETSLKNKKLADNKPKSISSSYEQQHDQQKYGTQHERYQTEKKKLDEYANYASVGYASDEKPVAGVSSQTYNTLQQSSKPQLNDRITRQKSFDTSQKTDFSDMTPDLDRFGVSKLNDDLSTPFYQSNDGEVNGEKILHKKRENLSYGSNQNIGAYNSFAYDSESNRPSNKVFLNSPSQSHTEVSSSYSPLLSSSVGNSNSGNINSAQYKLLYNNAMIGNSADNIYSSASTIYNPAVNNAKNSYTSRYLSAKPYSSYYTQENYNTSPKFNEYNSETSNGEIKDNDNNYDFHTSISLSSQKSTGYTIPSNSANLDSHEKQTSTGFVKQKDYSLINDGECYDNKAVHTSDHSFSSVPNDEQKTIISKSMQATERPTQTTSTLTTYDSDEIDPSKLDLKIVHLPISVLKRLVASGELGLPSFQ